MCAAKETADRNQNSNCWVQVAGSNSWEKHNGGISRWKCCLGIDGCGKRLWGWSCIPSKKTIHTQKCWQKTNGPSLAGTQIIDRAWRSLKNDWWPQHVNATSKVAGHTLMSDDVKAMVNQWVFRQSLGPITPIAFLEELKQLLKQWGKKGYEVLLRSSLEQCKMRNVKKHWVFVYWKSHFVPRPSIKRVPCSLYPHFEEVIYHHGWWHAASCWIVP